jgi:NADPH:quinone reductase-like Zn-dependent oxidoreductase
MNRAVMLDSFGGPDVLHLREVPEPHAGANQLRVRVAAAGLNPMDWMFIADDEFGTTLRAARRAMGVGGILPEGFGHDYAGVVDEVGEGVTGFAVGDRVFGGALSRAVADCAIVAPEEAHHTPDGLDDMTAAVLDVSARTACAALAAIEPGEGDIVLIGGATGGVGLFAVQLARFAGAKVIGTASEASFDYLRALGAQPVAYGAGLAARMRALFSENITAAADLFGTETVHAALELGVPAARIVTIAAQVPMVMAVSGMQAAPGALERVAEFVANGKLRVPIAATYPVEKIREAVHAQASRHTKGKIVVTLRSDGVGR